MAEHNKELNAFEIPSPRSCIVCILGVGAVYEFPKKVRLVGDVDSLQFISAVVSIPSGHGGLDAREYIRFAFGRWYFVLECDVRHGFCGG